MKEFTPGLCWDFVKLQEIINALVAAGFKGLRIFFNLRDLPYIKKPTQTYIQHCFDTMPNGMHTFTFEGSPSPDVPKDMMRDSFLLCKRLNWLPMVCIGTSEEAIAGEWLGRVPINQKEWLGRFAQELGIYLKYTMGFKRVDCEGWNEFTKCMTVDTYDEIMNPIADGWNNSKAGKVWLFSDDILRQDKLNGLLTKTTLLKKVTGFTTHAGVGAEDSEFDDNLIVKTTAKLAQYNLQHFVSELTVNGKWERLNQLAGTSGYGLIGAVRSLVNGNLLGTRMDDIWLFEDGIYRGCSSPSKAEILKNFNKTNYKPYVVTEDDMVLDKIYKIGSKGIAVKFIQKVLNEDIEIELLNKLVVDGSYGSKTKFAVEEYQRAYGLVADGMVGEKTFKVMIFDNPNLFDELVYSYAIGER